MKRIFTLLGALLLSGAALSAQEVQEVQEAKATQQIKSTTYMTNMGHKRGYRADVDLAISVDRKIDCKFDITSSHGFSFGNGLYVGGGVGFGAEFIPYLKAVPTYLVPLFADIKYSFMNTLATPFVSMKGGISADITNSGIRTFANPAIGVDIARFSIKVGYEYQLGIWGAQNSSHIHAVKIGLGYTF